MATDTGLSKALIGAANDGRVADAAALLAEGVDGVSKDAHYGSHTTSRTHSLLGCAVADHHEIRHLDEHRTHVVLEAHRVPTLLLDELAARALLAVQLRPSLEPDDLDAVACATAQPWLLTTQILYSSREAHGF